MVSIKSVADIMAEITAASAEQSDGIRQVNQAIAKMDEATQQNAALVEQAAAAAGSMREQANNLNHAVGIFKTQEHAATPTPPAVRAALKPAQKTAQKTARAAAKPVMKTIAAAPVSKKAAAKPSEDSWEEF